MMLDRILARKHELAEVPNLGGLAVNATFDSDLEARFVEELRRVEVDGARAAQVRANLVHGKPGYVLQVGAHTYYVETQADLGASDGVVEPSRPDFLIRPARPAPGRPPVAVFTDGFAFHRAETDADSRKRMALVRAGFLVWSLTWDDLEFVFGGTPDVPDLLAGAPAGDGMAALQRTLDGRWDTADLRSRLAETTLALLVRYLRAPEPDRWKQAVFTVLFALFDRRDMLGGARRAAFDRADADALPGQAREALDDLPAPVAVGGAGSWTGTAPASFDLFTALPLAAVEREDPDAAARGAGGRLRAGRRPGRGARRSRAGLAGVRGRCTASRPGNGRRRSANADASGGVLLAESVAMALAAAIGKREAHARVAATCRRAADERRPLAEVLGDDPRVTRHLDRDAVARRLAADGYLGATRDYIERVVERVGDSRS